MKKQKKLLIILLVFVVVIVGAYVLYDQYGASLSANRMPLPEDDRDEADEHANPAPDFTVYDADGNEIHLSDYEGKPVVLNFWASWCGPCKMEMPDFQKMYRELGDSVTFLMVNVTDGFRETERKASEFIEEQGYTFPVLYDIEQDAANTYIVRSLPTTYFIDADGNLIAQSVGAINEETLQDGINLLLD